MVIPTLAPKCFHPESFSGFFQSHFVGSSKLHGLALLQSNGEGEFLPVSGSKGELAALERGTDVDHVDG